MKIKDRLKGIIALDYRSLALLRIGLGVTIICDLIERLIDFKIFYTDTGVLSRADLFTLYGGDWYFSFYNIAGIWQLQLIFIILAFVSALAMVFGYRTTLATIISWLLLVSIGNRNPLILQGGDVIFRVILFWAIFLPLGKYMSVDSLIKSETLKNKNYYGVPALAYIVQIFLFYFLSGLLKTGDAWTSGQAVYYALSLDQMTRGFGEYLLAFPVVMSTLTYGVLYLEIAGPILMLSPFKNGPIRTFVIFALAFMQIGINSTMHLGFFGMISIVVTLGLLPSWFWDTLYKKLRNLFAERNKKVATIYYDAECGFCFKAVHLLKRLLWLSSNVTIKTPDTEMLQNEMGEKNSWIVVDHRGTHHYKTAGLATVLALSPIFFWKSYLLSLGFIQKQFDKIYDYIANTRKLICLPETTKKKRSLAKYARNIFVIFLTTNMVLINIESMPSSKTIIPENINFVAEVLRMDQRWDMFTPYPLTQDGWYVIPGVLLSGETVDLFRNGETINYEKPKNVSALYKNQRWQKYMMNLWQGDFSKYRLGYGKYLCREWNQTHEGMEILKTFQIIYMLENTHPNYEKSEVIPTTIWDHHCF